MPHGEDNLHGGIQLNCVGRGRHPRIRVLEAFLATEGPCERPVKLSSFVLHIITASIEGFLIPCQLGLPAFLGPSKCRKSPSHPLRRGWNLVWRQVDDMLEFFEGF